MSYSTWVDYGYGICVDDIKGEIELERLLCLIEKAPNLYKSVKEYFADRTMSCSNDILEDYEEDRGDSNFGGLAEILCEVIKEVEEIELYVCEDFNGNSYLIYPPDYPWQIKKMSKKEQELTEDALVELFTKYLQIVTDEALEVKYRSVANGG